MSGSQISESAQLIQVEGLRVRFAGRGSPVIAVRDMDLTLKKGESLGIVGESGSGKTTVLRAIAGLLPSRNVENGSVSFKNTDILKLSERERTKIRGSGIGLIFQDPVNCFNPSFTIKSQLTRVLRLHQPGATANFNTVIASMFERVGIDPTGKLNRYPFEFSQGQLQRLMIAAVCLGSRPDLLLADEPTTSLDVTTEAQIISLLGELRRELGMSLLLVTHNIAVAAQLCDRLVVMYAGTVVEEGPLQDILSSPAHPYTKQLIQSIPKFPHEGGRLYAMPGDAAGALAESSGCPFAPRCEVIIDDICTRYYPTIENLTESDRRVACHHHGRSLSIPGHNEGIH